MTAILDAIPPAGPGEPWIVPTDFEHRRYEPLPGWLQDLLFWPMPPPEWAARPATLSPEDMAAVRRAGGL